MYFYPDPKIEEDSVVQVIHLLYQQTPPLSYE